MLPSKSYLSFGMLLTWGLFVSLLPSQILASETPLTPTFNLETSPYPFTPSLPPLSETDLIPTPNLETPPPPTETKTLATHLIIKLKERRVYAYKDAQILVHYPVAVGKKGWETPTGKFQIIKMIRNPVWRNPWNGKVVPAGANNPLGERWIGFWTDGKNTIGFHGTKAENLLGQAVSHGCVRMRNRDIVALFEIVQMGTPVIVQP